MWRCRSINISQAYQRHNPISQQIKFRLGRSTAEKKGLWVDTIARVKGKKREKGSTFATPPPPAPCSARSYTVVHGFPMDTAIQ